MMMLSGLLAAGCAMPDESGGGGGSGEAPPRQEAEETRRFPQFENEHVRVWRTVIAPNQPLSMHRHEFGRTIVALRGGTLEVVNEAGERRSMTWETGSAYWLDADPPGELHGDVNPGPDPVEVVVVEMKR